MYAHIVRSKVYLVIEINLIVIPGLFQHLKICLHLVGTPQAQCHHQRIDNAKWCYQ